MTEAEVKKNVGKLVREIRRDSFMSQSQLGEVLRVSHAAISDIENGKSNLSLFDLIELSDCFGFYPGDFIQRVVKDRGPHWTK